MRFQLVTLTGITFDEEIYQVVLPTLDGDISVFAHHMPLVSVAVPGIITVRHKAGDRDEQQEVFATDGGIIEVTREGVRMLVDEATPGDAIHEQDARDALARARALKAEAKDAVSLEQAQALVDREATRLKVAELRKHHRHPLKNN